MELSSLQDSGALTAILMAVAYLLGSISSAILVCRLFGLPDPRTEGSHNPGATNVMRLGGKPAAALTLLGDVLKGVIPVTVAWQLNLPALHVSLVGFCAFLGHLLPIFFRFQGGKGVATAFGVLFPLYWPAGLGTGLAWLIVFALFRVSSLASMSAFILMPVMIYLKLPAAFWPMLAMSGVMIARHHENIRKLLNGEELGFRRSGDA